MRIDDYPPQELSGAGQVYHAECLRRGAGIEGIELAYGDDPYQGVLLFPSARPDGTVLAFWHGGGWTGGYKEWMAFMAPPLNQAGITFASLGYRLAPAHVFPAGLEDCARGLAFLADEVAAHGGDPERIFLGGHSAGGHYASLLAVRRDWPAAVGLPADIVRGCLPISGVFQFTAGSGLSMRPRFLGPGETERAASPLLNIEETPPPFLIAYGTADFPHLIPQAERMAGALLAAGGEVETVVMPGRDHFQSSYAGGEPDGPWVPRALDWLAAH